MYFIQPHYHGISRTTDDYERMAMAGRRGGGRAVVLGGLRPASRGHVPRLFPADQRV